MTYKVLSALALLSAVAPLPAHADVVINEFLPALSGTDAGHEWVEIFNDGSAPVDLSGWTIRRAKNQTSTPWQVRFTMPPGTSVPAGGFLVVGDWLVDIADLRTADGVTLDLGNATSTGDAVAIHDADGAVVDTVIYGPNNDMAFLDDNGVVAESIAPRPTLSHSLARRWDGFDTNDSGLDFVSDPEPTPGAPNPVVPIPVCEPSVGGIVINELMPALSGPDAGREWLELFNASQEIVRLDGWRIERAKNANQGFGNRFQFPGEVEIAPGAFVVVGDWLVAEADFALPDGSTLDLGNATQTGDVVRLVDCEGAVVDTVVYGPNNDQEFLDDTGEIATSIGPRPIAEQSLARIQDGLDTDRSGDDFVVQPEPTPGAPNPVVEPVVCVPSPGGVVVNEVLSDVTGPDAGYEWIELYNASDEPVSIAGWWISAVSQPTQLGRKDISFPANTTIPPRGFFVVGDEFVDEADLTVTMTVPDGGNGAAVRLYDCEGTSLDTVVYGSNNNNELPDDRGRIDEHVRKPPANQSIARVEDGVDTDSVEDWFIAAQPTPGASNVVQGGGGGGGRGGGCGARDRAPGERGCATVPGPLGWLGLGLFGIAIARRRR